ncbi:TetR/AcrR family transcriptional regulator [Agromyces protaetiae]|uniref:TetR/AcrR family transcriptional regulator n=1 Tax=Agromyces protaetiae TaxID=2509455 RepID=A0A4P6FEL8_9MICO|nr:TetR/AcrR family transcriptional regulator [Agromyces protaetiae]QAY73453.1 TetR/AcrR family transcriptional regulator [Agromyces protaetiae]
MPPRPAEPDADAEAEAAGTAPETGDAPDNDAPDNDAPENTGRRARLSPEERRAQLVALGVAALAEAPLEGLSIGELARRAGVSRPLFFHYFGSKQGFDREVVAVARDSMLHATEPNTELAPTDRLADTLTRTVGFVREHRGTFYSLVRGAASGDPQVREVVEEARAQQTERVVALFVERRIVVSEPLRLALRAWIAYTEQLLVDAALGSDIPSDELVRILIDSLAGIARAADRDAARALFG